MSAIIHSLAGQSFDPTAKHIKDFWNPKVTAGSCNKTLPGYLQAVLDRRDDDGDNAPLAQADVQVPTPSKPSTPEESAHSDQREEPTQAEADAQQPSGDDLPIRVITLDAADAKFASESLPKFVAVIDIDRLPHIDEPLPATNPQLGRTSEPSSTAPSSSN